MKSKLKLNQIIRTIIQTIGILLVVTGFMTNYRVTMMIIMGLMIISGAFYCGWLCPFGTLQEWSHHVGKLLKIKRRQMTPRLHKHLKYLRYLILVLFTVLTADWIFTLMVYNPEKGFSSMLTGTVSAVGSLVILAFLIISMFYERFFCNYLCMEGAKYSLMSSFKIVSIHRNEEKCIGCKKCDRVCSRQIEISTSNTVQTQDCINCLKCMDVCPVKETLQYKKIKHLRIRMVIIVLGVVSLALTSFVRGQDNVVVIGDENMIQTMIAEANDEDSKLTTSSEAVSTTSISVTTTSESDLNLENITVETLENITEKTTVEMVTQLYRDGVYTGQGVGFKGKITVEISILGDVIESIKVIDHNDDRKWYNRAVEIIDHMLEVQSTDVDLVSGATYSSRGIRDAVEAALEQAK